MSTLKQIPRVVRLRNSDGGSVAIGSPSADSKLRRFSMLGYTGKPVDRWYGRLVFDLSGMTTRTAKSPILLSHEEEDILGHCEKITIDNTGVHAEGVMSGPSETVAPVVESADNGFPWQASIGCSIDSAIELLDDKSSMQINGVMMAGPLTVATKSTLFEISFTPFGADSDTSSAVLANQSDGSTVTVERFTPMTEKTTDPTPAPAPTVDTAKITADATATGYAAATKDAADRMAALNAAFPNDPKFALEQFVKGHDTIKAKAEYCDVLQARETARLAAVSQGAPLMSVAGGGTKPAPASVELAADDHRGRAELEWETKPESRAGFTSRENFVSARVAQKQGRLRVLGGTVPAAE